MSISEKAVVDRIVDGHHAVLHVGAREAERVIPADQLPDGAKEGDWLQVRFEEEQLKEATIDREETENRRDRIAQKMRRLRKRGR